jgi:hypothetical protein
MAQNYTKKALPKIGRAFFVNSIHYFLGATAGVAGALITFKISKSNTNGVNGGMSWLPCSP